MTNLQYAAILYFSIGTGMVLAFTYVILSNLSESKKIMKREAYVAFNRSDYGFYVVASYLLYFFFWPLCVYLLVRSDARD